MLYNNLNQTQLAYYLIISRSSYRNIENNVVLLTVETIEKLVLFYHTSFEYLLGLTNIQESLDETIYKVIQQKYNISIRSIKTIKTSKKQAAYP
ncbi:MAG: helix-turn-helix domain-containing protein [Ignavibacteriales bacterium]